ncbi:MAG: hypothetical protein O3B41_07645 [Bacteroidetes bacterium]|nr:hypothetical protein [Bacteroidota bacterium]
MKKSFLQLLLFIAVTLPATAQESIPETLDLFIDCGRSCDFDYMRREIPYINYVRDRVGADVHLLITEESTGSGGRNFKLEFIGLDQLASMKDDLAFVAGSTDTSNEVREGLTNTIARGLVRFLMTTEMGKRIEVSVPVTEQSTLPENVQVIDDPWNFWVFNVRMSGSYEAEESNSKTVIETNVSADRVTEEWKFLVWGRMNYRESRFDLSTGTIRSSNRDGSVYGQLVKSLSERWSAGLTTYTNTSSSNNTNLSTSISPTVEFSFFPYTESSTRDLRARYEINLRKNSYDELTVYNELDQLLIQNQLQLMANFRQPWGSARASISLESYVTDFEESLFDLYNVALNGNIDFRVARGLSINLEAKVSSVHDQIWLPLEESDDEDVLLGNRKLPTSFEYEMKLGFSYRFGSIYNNIVNPRFGFFGGGGGSSSR